MGDSLLLQASEKGKRRAAKYSMALPFEEDARPVASSSRPKQTPVAPPVAVDSSSGSAASLLQNLAKSLDGSADPSTKDLLHELRLKTVSYERELCEAKLQVAQTQVAKVEAEEAVLRAKKACSQKE